MKTTQDHRSLWSATADVPRFPALHEDVEADVCVVGAGIAGLTTAYSLLREGRTVVVLDDGPVAGATSAMTTAHLASALDDRYFVIEHLHGTKGARLAAESHTAAIERIAAIVDEERIPCALERVDGYLFAAPGTDAELLERELAAAHRAGLSGVVHERRTPHFDGPCLRFPRQAQFHPLEYLAGLANAIARRGGRIYTHTHVDTIQGGSPARIGAGDHTVTALAVVVATNTPVNDRVAVHTKQAAYTTYAVGALVPRGSVTAALFWDTGDPYHYIRLQRGASQDDVLIVGGEDHKTGQEPDPGARYARLEAWTREHFPFAHDVAFTWSGQVMETIDGIAFIGRNPLDDDNVYVVTGDSGMGLTHGTIAGMLLPDLIQGRDNPWAELYDPSRKTLRAIGTYVREAVNMAAQYADWITEGEVDDEAAIRPGHGAVVRHGLTKVAAYRDDAGLLHRLSAVCPHLGGLVRWNDEERTWDCPCHGSRFDKLGSVLHGPANDGLTPVAKPG